MKKEFVISFLALTQLHASDDTIAHWLMVEKKSIEDVALATFNPDPEKLNCLAYSALAGFNVAYKAFPVAVVVGGSLFLSGYTGNTSFMGGLALLYPFRCCGWSNHVFNVNKETNRLSRQLLPGDFKKHYNRCEQIYNNDCLPTMCREEQEKLDKKRRALNAFMEQQKLKEENELYYKFEAQYEG